MVNITHEEAIKLRNDLVEWIRIWFKGNASPDSKAVIGISGGKDSTVVAALCVEALGKDRVFGVLMPNGEQADIDDSYCVCKYLGIDYKIVNIHDAVEGIKNAVALEENSQMAQNLPPRIRMATLYYVAQSMNGRVINTSNRSEGYVGWGTIYGDCKTGDMSPLGRLTVTEVIAIGKTLNIPERFVVKPPSDGLTGKTDEDNLGFTYAVLDEYILTGVCEDKQVKEAICDRYVKSGFKRDPMVTFNPWAYGVRLFTCI